MSLVIRLQSFADVDDALVILFGEDPSSTIAEGVAVVRVQVAVLWRISGQLLPDPSAPDSNNSSIMVDFK